jgi:opacity protein-like surface antigen
MRAQISALAAFIVLGALPALAQDDGYGYSFHEGMAPGTWPIQGFAGLRGSFAFSGTTATTVPTAPPTQLRAAYNTGGGSSIYIGTRLPLGLKLELEGMYRYLPFNQVSMNGVPSVAHGQAQLAAPMVNLRWDLPVGDFLIQPFIGGGVGAAYTALRLSDPTNANVYLQNKKWALAYDAMGGASLALSPTSRFTAMYRWMRVDGLDSHCGTAGAPTFTCKTNLDSQSVDLGLEMDL